jgi:hypothetical protein
MSPARPTSEPTSGESPPLVTRVVRVKLRDLRLLEQNARFMPGAQFRQLVENLKLDGALTSTPLVYQGRVLSGNHRVEAAIEAGIEEADIIEVLTPLDDKRQVALQLSHNAIVGQDDPGMLAELYRDLDIEWKQYSGLTDAALNDLHELDVNALALGQPEYQELVLLFLPEEQGAFLRALKGIEAKLKKGVPIVAGRYDDFDRFFQAVVAMKKVKGVHNSALAVRMIAELALAQLEPTAQTSVQPPEDEGAGERRAEEPPAVERADEAPEHGDHEVHA